MHVGIRALVFSALVVFSGACAAADTIKIALIDALSGPSATRGHTALRHYQAAADFANKNGGALGLKLEIVPIDNKSSVEETVAGLRLAIDLGIRYVAQGIGSEITSALIAAIDEHNDQNPGRAVLLLNYGSGDPVLTGAKCSYWHFRFDANDLMKLATLVDDIGNDPAIGNVYLINEDNAWGRMISRETRRLLSEKRDDIHVVGDDFYAPGSVKNFAPVTAKLVESSANAVITGNSDEDLSLLIQAAGKAGVKTSFHTMYAAYKGTPAAIVAAGPADIRNVMTWHPNIADNRLDIFARQYREKYGEDWQIPPIYLSVHMLVTAMETVRGLEPARVAPVIEGLSFLGPNGAIAMRKDDHQMFQPLFVARLAKTGAAGVSYEAEATGFGWKTVLRLDTDKTVLPSTCRMPRPK